RVCGATTRSSFVTRGTSSCTCVRRPLWRASRVGSRSRKGPTRATSSRELEVASHAARAGAPVIPPADALDAGPHRHGGHIVTFWRYVEARRPVDPRAAGQGLRVIHDALTDFDGVLPAAGHPDDVEAMLASLETSADVELLRTLAA